MMVHSRRVARHLLDVCARPRRALGSSALGPYGPRQLRSSEVSQRRETASPCVLPTEEVIRNGKEEEGCQEGDEEEGCEEEEVTRLDLARP